MPSSPNNPSVSTTPSSDQRKVPRRPYGTTALLSNDKLPATLPMIGLGCSSFSTFFWTPQEHEQYGTPFTTVVDSSTTAEITINNKDHPKVQEWIETIRYAVLECGMTLLDTAPWYGHGTSEMVIGLAFQECHALRAVRKEITIQTKVGRYEQDITRQFDFSYNATIQSILRSQKRLLKVDVLQLHDPEFAPSLDQLMNETIPAMIYAQEQGWCQALGMTGYPLEVQYQILQRSLDVFGRNVWDQAMTYGHFNLHNQRLMTQPIGNHSSFAAYCKQNGTRMGLLAAAPLSMGLLTSPPPSPPPPTNTNTTAIKSTLPTWHPAGQELKDACRVAALQCQQNNQSLALLATIYALCCNPQIIASTIIGCKNVDEVRQAAQVANRFHAIYNNDNDDGDQWESTSTTVSQIAQKVMTTDEYQLLQQLLDPRIGPFANVWNNDLHHWDGIRVAQEFWKAVPTVAAEQWHDRSLIQKDNAP